MEDNHYLGLGILLLIIAIAIFGGNKNAKNSGGFFGFTQEQKTEEQKAIDIKVEQDKVEWNKIHSKYTNKVKIDYISTNTDPAQEYVSISLSSSATTSVDLSGWTLRSAWSGQGTNIPYGTLLYFQNTQNVENDLVILYPGDRAYIVTGVSPIGTSFRVNMCSGYLSQFKDFTPYISNDCPAPNKEDLSSIPHRIENDQCFDYIDSYPRCRVQTETLPRSFSYECTNFITTKLNYNACITNHKNEKDFYGKEWRLYLKRSTSLWMRNKHEEVVLYDNLGKIVDDYKF